MSFPSQSVRPSAPCVLPAPSLTPDWPPLPIGRSVIGAVSAVRRAPARPPVRLASRLSALRAAAAARSAVRSERAFLLLRPPSPPPSNYRSLFVRLGKGKKGRERVATRPSCCCSGSANGARCFGSAQKYRLSDRLSKEGRGRSRTSPYVRLCG